MKYVGTFNLGSFIVTSGKLRVSDPCYDKDTWCAGVLEAVKNGAWIAKVVKSDEDSWGKRCAELVVHHREFNLPDDSDEWEVQNIDVGVDSGQAGFFDEAYYGVDYSEDYLQTGREEHNSKQSKRLTAGRIELLETRIAIEQDEKKKKQLQLELSALKELDSMDEPKPTRDFYDICCDMTLSDMGAGVLNNGAVSSSGYGDGGYYCYAQYDENNKIVAAKIVFIDESDEEE